MMPRKTKSKTAKTIAALKHDEAKRRNIPTAEYQSVMQKEDQEPVKVVYPRDDSGLDEEKTERNRDLDPQLVWCGKDQQDWSDLVVNAPPLYIQEKVKPKVLIDDLLRQSKAGEQQSGGTADLFGDFNGLPQGADKTDFYQYEGNWQNRMILGDSLQVMASLTEQEGLRGKVQCIYFDPPYGIKLKWTPFPGQLGSEFKVESGLCGSSCRIGRFEAQRHQCTPCRPGSPMSGSPGRALSSAMARLRRPPEPCRWLRRIGYLTA